MSVKKIAAAAFAGAMSFAVSAAETGADDAIAAVRGWGALKEMAGTAMDAEPSDVAEVAGRDGRGKFFIVNLSGGGWAIVAGDTRLNPILAHGETGKLDAADPSPIIDMAKTDVANFALKIERQAAAAASGRASAASRGGVSNSAESAQEASWARYKAAGATVKKAGGRASAGGISEGDASSSVNVRVAPLLTTKWGQGGAANLYIPNGYPCGCTPLAGAQIMRYFKWPVTEGTGDDVFTVDTSTVFPTEVDGAAYTGDDPQRTLFGRYDWDSMPVYSDNTTANGADAIGKLVHDVAFSMGTKFAAGGSEISATFLANVMKNYFNYAGARSFQGDTSVALYAPVLFPAYIRTIKSNLDAKLPVALAVNGSGPHAVVADGYGYTKTDGELYVHINCGWGDSGIAWYNMTASSITLDTGSQGFNNVDAIVFNIFTKTYNDNYTIVSGRVTNELDGGVVAGATVTATYNKNSYTATADENGIYALMLPTDAPQSTSSNMTLIDLKARNYTITATKDGWNLVSQTKSVARNIAPGENGLNYNPENDLYLNNQADVDFTLSKRFAAPAITTADGTAVFVSGGAKTVTLTAPDAAQVLAETGKEVKLHYTVDGTTPTENSPSVSSGGTVEISSTCTLKVLPFADGSTYDNSESLAEKRFAAVDPAGNLIPNGDFEQSASANGGIRCGAANYSNPWWTSPNDNTIVAKPYKGSTWVQAVSQYGAKAAILQTSGARTSARLAHDAFIVPAAGVYRFQFDYSARNSTKWGVYVPAATTTFTLANGAGTAVSSGSVTPESGSPATYVASVELAAGVYTLVFDQGQYIDEESGAAQDKANVLDNIVLKKATAAPEPSIALESGAFNFFGDSAKVVITSGTAGAAIFYTTDGTDPTAASAQYTAPFSISADTTVKAIVVAPGYTASAAASAAFKRTAVVGENLVRGATAIGGENAATTTFTAHSAGSYGISFTYSGAAGGVAEVVATSEDGTEQVVATVTAGEEAQTYEGAVEIAGGGAYTLSLRAQGGGATTIALGDLAVLMENSAANVKNFWIVENKTAHNATGSWSPATEYANGRIMFDDPVAYTATRAASTRYATIRVKMNFIALNATGETAAPESGTKAAMRIGDVSESFELYTRDGNGSPAWVAVAAEGVSPTPSTDYSLVFRLDTQTKTYTAAVLDANGAEIPFKNGTQARFPFACDSSEAVGTVTFDCSGAVESIYGTDKSWRKGFLLRVE